MHSASIQAAEKEISTLSFEAETSFEVVADVFKHFRNETENKER